MTSTPLPYAEIISGVTLELGRSGEDAAFQFEKDRLDKTYPNLAKLILPFYKLRHRSGYDILSFDDSGKPFYIEVKTSSDDTPAFTLTKQEYRKACKATSDGEQYLINPLGQLIKKLTEEHERNKILFRAQYDHTHDGFLIRYPDGKRVSPNALSNAFAKFIQKHNLKGIRYYDLRHSCANILYAMEVDLLTIQRILGHAQLSTTLLYTHIINDRRTEVLQQMSTRLTGDSDGN